MAKQNATPCSELAVALAEAVYARAQAPDAPTFDAIIREMTADLEGVDRKTIVEAITAYERHQRAQRGAQTLSNLEQVKEDALIEAGTRERVAAALKRLQLGERRPQGRQGRKRRNQAIEELRQVERELRGREAALERVRDLEAALESGELPAKKTATPETATPEGARAKALREEVNARRAVEDAEREIGEMERRLKEGDLARSPRRERRTANERLADLRRQRAALGRELALRREEIELRGQLERGELAAAGRPPGPPESETGRRVSELRRERRARHAEAASLERTRERIAELSREIVTGEALSREGRRSAPRSEELARLRETRDALQATVRRIEAQEAANERLRKELATGERPGAKPRRGPETPLERENEALRRQVAERRTALTLEEQIADLERQVESGQFRDREGKFTREPGEAVARLRETRARLEREIALRKQLEELRGQIERGEIAEPQARERQVDPKIEELEFEVRRAKSRARRILEDLRPKRWPEKFLRMPSRLLVNLLATGEFSAVGIQGMVPLLSRPGAAARSLPRAIEALVSERGEDRVQQFIESHPLYHVFARAGGYVSEAEAALTRREEGALSRLFDRIPVLRGFNRFHRQYLNLLRLNLFEALAHVHTANGEPTAQEAQALANWANKATGRGGLGSLERAGPLLADIGFAPRYTVSRFQIALGEPIWSAQGGRMKLAIAREYARAIGGFLMLSTVVTLLGGEDDEGEDRVTVEHDPTSTDFGQFRVGGARIDATGGLRQAIVFMNRLMQGRVTRESGVSIPWRGEDRPHAAPSIADLIYRFGRSKAAPGLGIALDLLSRETWSGEPATPANTAKQFAGPIAYQNIYEVLTGEMGIGEKAALTALNFFMPVNVYDERLAPPDARYLRDVAMKLEAKGDPDRGGRRTREEERDYRAVLTGEGGWASTWRRFLEEYRQAEARGDEARMEALTKRLAAEAQRTRGRLRGKY